jgi:hypothetical protein
VVVKVVAGKLGTNERAWCRPVLLYRGPDIAMEILDAKGNTTESVDEALIHKRLEL